MHLFSERQSGQDMLMLNFGYRIKFECARQGRLINAAAGLDQHIKGVDRCAVYQEAG